MSATSLLLWGLLLAVSGCRAAAPARALLAASDCPRDIPRCATGRCELHTVGGVLSSVCQQCLATFVPTRYGLNCVCPPGTFETSAGGFKCVDCGKGFYCPGGSMAAANGEAKDRGQRLSCFQSTVSSASDTEASVAAKGLMTKATRAKLHTDCYPLPGWRLKVATRTLQEAELCLGASYSPGYARIRVCLPCMAGLVLPTGYNNSVPKVNRTAVCSIPAGKYLAQNVVRPCPQGTFRTGQAGTDEPMGRSCLHCPKGLTTAGPSSTNVTACNYGVGGYQLSGQIFSQAIAMSDLFDPDLCPPGTFYAGGTEIATDSTFITMTCTQCPDGATTLAPGALSTADCMVPPGYYIDASNPSSPSMQKCRTILTHGSPSITEGFYREGWLHYKDPAARDAVSADGAAACTPCGDGILSEWTDIDEREDANDTTKVVAASSASCYVTKGMGVVVDPERTCPTDSVGAQYPGCADVSGVARVFLKAVSCPKDTYGAPNVTGDRTYGLFSVPCKPCARGLITAAANSSAIEQCVTPAGFGYTAEGGAQCAQGWYSPGGDQSACRPCPPGRTTDYNPARPELQAALSDCYVMPGYGLYDPSLSKPWDDVAIPDSKNLSAVECPAGRWSAGGSRGASNGDALCTACGGGLTTLNTRSVVGTDCSACVAGFGWDSTGCTKCAYNTYQPLEPHAGGCTTCGGTMFVFKTTHGVNETINSTGITLRTGAAASQACVARQAQLPADVGQSLGIAASLGWATAGTGQTMAQCLAFCPTDKVCFAELTYYDNSTGTGDCRKLELDPVAACSTLGTYQLYYKLLPSDAVSAFSVGGGGAAAAEGSVSAKVMSSGLYARAWAGTALQAAWNAAAAVTGAPAIGAALPAPNADWQTLSPTACKRACDNLSTCWGFIAKVATDSTQCLLRGGNDARNVRTFLSAPDSTTFATLESLAW
ncbi:hypothetical protein HT031_004639 [Scenedesmus sp. PABB004]|nr:hypothetical protein HT031_004639 [Scenedesmus sp. PABB004]